MTSIIYNKDEEKAIEKKEKIRLMKCGPDCVKGAMVYLLVKSTCAICINTFIKYSSLS